MADNNFIRVYFKTPAWVQGLGMVGDVDTRPDPETGRPRIEAIITLVADLGWLRISTPSGETWVPDSNIASAFPLFVDRHVASKAKAGLAQNANPNATTQAPVKR